MPVTGRVVSEDDPRRPEVEKRSTNDRDRTSPAPGTFGEEPGTFGGEPSTLGDEVEGYVLTGFAVGADADGFAASDSATAAESLAGGAVESSGCSEGGGLATADARLIPRIAGADQATAAVVPPAMTKRRRVWNPASRTPCD